MCQNLNPTCLITPNTRWKQLTVGQYLRIGEFVTISDCSETKKFVSIVIELPKIIEF